MSLKTPLSIIILTNRRDDRFKKCLTSAKFAQEVIVEENNNIQDFAHARNTALQKATQPWVFFLDSDEIISEDSIKNIKKIIKDDSEDGIYVKRIDVFHGKALKWGEVGNVWLLRMFKKDHAKFSRPIHEVAIVKGSVKKSLITLWHYSHPSISEFIQDISKYSKIEAMFRLEQESIKMSNNKIICEMILYPPIKLILNFFFKLGFLDGWRGVIYAIIMSIHSLMVRIYLYEFTKNNNR